MALTRKDQGVYIGNLSVCTEALVVLYASSIIRVFKVDKVYA